jgi:hypothetical protein
MGLSARRCDGVRGCGTTFSDRLTIIDNHLMFAQSHILAARAFEVHLCMGLDSSRCRPPTRDVRTLYSERCRRMLIEAGVPGVPPSPAGQSAAGRATGAEQNDGRRFVNQAFATGLPDPFGAGSSYSNTRGMRLLVRTKPS